LVRLLKSQENPLDQPVPDINVPVLIPQPPSKKVQRFKEYAADKRQTFKKYVHYKWNRFVNWLTQHLPPLFFTCYKALSITLGFGGPPKPKVIDEAFEHVKNTILKLFPRKKDTLEVVETKSALKKFAKKYIITSRDVYDPVSFMDAAKKPSSTF